MSQTHFLIVSGKPSTDDLARVIVEDCLPSAGVLSSYGNILSDGGGYEYRIGGKFSHFDQLQDGFKNHLAQFIRAASISDATARLNLFFLDNPYGENDYDQSTFLDLLKIKDDSRHGFDNLIVWHIVLAYDTARPANVVTTSEDDVMNFVFKSQKGSEGLFTCYVGTQNMTGGATFMDLEHHDFHLPRMLADFMLLASDPSTRDKLQQATAPSNVRSGIFSIGHSEYMYYPPEVKQLGRIYLEDALLTLRLFGNDETEPTDPFDTSTNPIGLSVRTQSLKGKYGTPNYSTPIECPENVNIEIDNIIAEAFGCYIGEEAPLANILYTRKDVHEASVAYDVAKIKGTQTRIDETTEKFNRIRRGYERMLETAASEDFAQILKSEIRESEETIASLTQDRRRLEDEKNGRGLWTKICEFFSGENKRRKIRIKSIEEETKVWDRKRENAEKAAQARERLHVLFEAKKRYADLRDEVEKLKEKRLQNAASINSFRLKSYDDTKNLVDISKLRDYFSEQKTTYEKSILEIYKNESPKKGLKCLNTCFESYAYEIGRRYDHVNWDSPFEFLNIEIESSYKNMWSKSLPYVHVSGTVGSAAFYSNTQTFISAQKEQYAQTGVKSLPDNYQTLLSETMEDKICMFKIVSLSDEYVKVLLGENKENALEGEVVSAPQHVSKSIGVIPQLPPANGVNSFGSAIKEKIPPRSSQMGVGFRLIREVRFSEAKEFFAKTCHDSDMAAVCTFLIRGRRLIDAIDNGANGEMSEEAKEKVHIIDEVFTLLGIKYVPLKNVVEKYLEKDK